MLWALRHPIRLIPVLYLIAITLGTLVLWWPVSCAGDLGAPFITALFTSVSAVAVTGLIVEDTPVYWSFFGQIAILVLIQIGGLGTKTAASFLAITVGRGFVIRRTLEREVERKQLNLSDAKFAIKLILVITLVVEAVTAAILAVRFHQMHVMDWPDAIWHGVFHWSARSTTQAFPPFPIALWPFRRTGRSLCRLRWQ